MKNFILILSVFLALVLNSNAQLQDSNWYFGNEAGLNFDDGTSSPTTLTDGVMSTIGGSASISDDDGNLLFYTNGINVWGADHEIIPNGSGLYGSTTVSQSVLIVPNPNNEKEYYIITNQGQENGSLGLHYTVVKMTNDDDDNNNNNNNNNDYEYCNNKQTKVQICHKGKKTLCVSINAVQAHLDHGDTLGSCDDDEEPVFAVDRKNIQLLPFASEKLTAVYDQTNNSYWVVSFAPSSVPAHNDTFYAFKVDSNGINLTRESTFNFYAMNNDYTGGQMKISSDLTSLGMTHNTIEIDKDGGLGSAENVFTFDFNKDTGIVSSMNIQTAVVVENNLLELITSDNGFHNVHVLLTGRFNSINLVSSVYGFEFSPDGDKFYISTNEKIDYNTSVVSSYLNVLQVQYRNFDSSDPNRIQQVGNDALTSVYSLQLGMDRKIYVTDNTGNLDQISNPNGIGLNAEYENDFISLDGNIAGKGLPQLIKGMMDEVFSGSVSTKSSSIVLGNPFKNEFKIELLNVKSIEFYNQQGSKVKSVVYNDINDTSSYKVDTSDLNTGIYFLVIKDEHSQVWNETVIKI